MNQHASIQQAKVKIGHSACPHDCPSTCALDVELCPTRRIGRVRGAKDEHLHGRRHLRQGRALCRAHPPSRPPAEAAGALGRKGRGRVEGGELGGGARPRRRKIRRGRSRSTAPRRSGRISTPARWGRCSATASSGCATPRDTPASSARSAPTSPGPATSWAPARCTAPTRARWRSPIASSSGAPMRSPPRST